MRNVIFYSTGSGCFLESYYESFGDMAQQARSSRWVYKPEKLPLVIDDGSLNQSLRNLAADFGVAIEEVYGASFSGKIDLSGYLNWDIASQTQGRFRRESPNIVRLDVVDTPEGLKVLEINSGNCGGAVMYGHIKNHLVREHDAKDIPSLPEKIDKLHYETNQGKVVSFYIGEVSKFLSKARNFRLANSLNPPFTTELAPLRDFDPRTFPDACYYLDSLLKGMRKLPNFDVIARYFSGEANLRTINPLSDRFLSDKRILVDILTWLKPSTAGLLKKWLLPTCHLDPKNPVLDFRSWGDYGDFDNIVLKPTDACGGKGVTIITNKGLPVNQGFYRGSNNWVAQPFVEPSTAIDRTEDVTYNLIYGVFLVRDSEKLRYAGTTVRFSPDLVVNLGRGCLLGLVVEPEWNLNLDK